MAKVRRMGQTSIHRDCPLALPATSDSHVPPLNINGCVVSRSSFLRFPGLAPFRKTRACFSVGNLPLYYVGPPCNQAPPTAFYLVYLPSLCQAIAFDCADPSTFSIESATVPVFVSSRKQV